MLISETMLNALYREPQAAITLNLVPQLLKDAILIPQNIIIEAGAMDPERNVERIMGVEGADKDYYIPLGRIFELNRETAVSYAKTNNPYQFPEIEIEVPPDIGQKYKQLDLFTTIQVFENEILENWQCSLTLPKFIMELDKKKAPVKRIGFRYAADGDPHFEYSIK
ncbi:MAG: hypothetical protein Q8920_02640 [Bacillota bacterium]|nr:hypothetical protein [Bacillota bacterium]